MELKDYLTIGIAALSLVFSLILSVFSSIQAKKLRELESLEKSRSAEISTLKGTKEEVSSTASRYMVEEKDIKIPCAADNRESHEYKLISSLIQSAIFERSDRAILPVLALLRDNYNPNKTEIDNILEIYEKKLSTLEKIELDNKVFNPLTPRLRINTLKKLFNSVSNV